MDSRNTRYIELFAGVGGFRLGIERALSVRDGQPSQRNGGTEPLEQGMEPAQASIRYGRTQPDYQRSGDARPLPYCVFANEWDKYAAQTYNKNFGGKIDQRDIRTIPTSDIPEHDLLVGGFPCQAFSIAGKRAGFDDTRGTMFFEVARILKDKKPEHLVLENVKGLLSHDSGRTFQTILGILADIGYRVEWQVLNSKDFGVPQNRERVFIVGHLGACCGRQVFPVNGLGMGCKNPAVTLTARGYGGQRNGTYVDVNPKEGRIRRLTPIECERLQGFPDNWTAGVSDTQRYKQMGNAVTVNVVEAVIKKLKEGTWIRTCDRR